MADASDSLGRSSSKKSAQTHAQQKPQHTTSPLYLRIHGLHRHTHGAVINDGLVAELADVARLKRAAERHGGSSPSGATYLKRIDESEEVYG